MSSATVSGLKIQIGEDCECPAMLAMPTSDGPWPGVVLIHDVFGLSRDLQSQAEWLASEGFLTIAPDLVSSGLRITCLVKMFSDLRRRSGPTFQRIEAARKTLVSRPDCTGAVGNLGFCVGGDFALLLADRAQYQAASINYGGVPPDIDHLAERLCPIVGSYGAKDTRLRDGARRLSVALDQFGVDHDIKEYPQAGHAFMNTAGPLVARLGRLSNAGLHPESAVDARMRIIAFLHQHLG